MLETETKLWYKNLEGCCRESCQLCTNLNVEEWSSYEVLQLEKHIKMSYKNVQHITYTYELPHMDVKKLKQGVVVEGKNDGHAGGPPNTE